MKRLLLAGTFLLPFAIVHAQQNDAYESLVSMADSAAEDKGPRADLDEDRSASAAPEAANTDLEAPAGAGSEVRGEARSEAKPAAPAPAPKRERPAPRHDDDAPPVAVPAAAAPRVWTKMFSSLLPSLARVPAFEVSVSTVVRRSRLEPAHPATAASAAGAAQGLIELVAAATTPTAPQSALDR
jgi:hypothetical protein